MNTLNAGLTVLLVEDDAISAMKLTLQLEELGYTVIHCSNGLEAFSMLELHKPNVVVSDINMPTIDGFAFLQLVRRSNGFSNLVFILISSYLDTDFVRKGMLLGADDYLPKPFEGSDLDAAIKVRINRFEGAVFKNEGYSEYQLKHITSSIFVNLSRRENEILLLIADSMSNKEMGELLNISAKTVMNHRQRIMDKLGLTGNGALYDYARKLKK